MNLLLYFPKIKMSEEIANKGEFEKGFDQNLPPEIIEILENPDIPDDTKSLIFSMYSEVRITREFSGPLPPPEILQGYNNALPNGAERVIAMAEKQSNHRMELEKFAIKEQLHQSKRGQHYGLIIVIICLGLSTVLAFNGLMQLALTIAGTTILGLASVFVIGKIWQSKKGDSDN